MPAEEVENMRTESDPSSDEDSFEEILDPYCDPNNPVIVTYERIADAAERIKSGVVRTPCTHTRLSKKLGLDLYFKKEYMQFTGSFKDRGALYSLLNLTEEQKSRGVITTSAGNHAQALAYQAAQLGIRATVIMPEQAPLVKVNSCRDLGARVILHGNRFDQAKSYAMRYGQEHDLVYINGYDHADILAGQGTIGIEILEDVPDVEYVIVPIGGGGLIAGISAAVKHLKPNVKIIGVESEKCPSWHTAMQNGRPVPCNKSKVGAKNTIADGLAVIEVGVNSFATANPLIDRVIQISEDHITVSILRLLEHEKSVVEGAGASGLAAVLGNYLPELQGKKVACVLCGGNIDVTVLGRVIDRGLMMDGRLCRFYCVISDRVGGLAGLLTVLVGVGASVKEILHDRMSLPDQVYKTGVHCVVETRDHAHSMELRSKLNEKYGDELHWHTE